MPQVVDYDPFASDVPEAVAAQGPAQTSGVGTPVDYDPFATHAEPTIIDKAHHVEGLTGRAVVQGVPAMVLGVPALAYDAADALTNVAKMGYNAARPKVNDFFHSDLPPATPVEPWRASKSLSGLGKQVADFVGLPEPKGKMETGLTGIGTAAASALGGANVAGSVARIMQGAKGNAKAVQTIFDALSDSPNVQALGAAGGAMAPIVAREGGIKNPNALAALGIVGSIGTGGISTLGGRAAGGVAQMVKPFANAGREVIIGKALNRVAENPAQAAETLANVQELVPGSRPTVGQASRDPGLIGADSAVRGDDTRNLIGGRLSEQNSARQRELGRIAGDEGTLAAATAKRNRTFDEIAQPAFDNAQPVNAGREWINNPVLRRIQTIRESPAGARQTVRDALDEAQSLLTQDGVDTTDARVLYEVRKDLALLRDGKLSGTGKSGSERSNLTHAREQIADVIDSVDSLIETGAPGYRDYMQMYAKRSIPLEDLKALQSVRDRAVLAVPDPVTGDPVLSQAKFTQLLRNNIATNPNYSGTGPGAATLRQTVPGTNEKVLARLSPQQLGVLDRVAADLDRGAAPQAGTVKSPGSDTFKNMSVAAVIGRVLGDSLGGAAMETAAGKTLARPFSFLYRVPDQEIQHLMLSAWLDPQLASRLMRTATEHEVNSIAADLKNRAARQATAAVMYSAPETAPPPRRPINPGETRDYGNGVTVKRTR